MATVNMRYDHPQYVVNAAAHGVMTAKGAAGTALTNIAYGAFVDTQIKAVHWCPLVAGTNTAATNVGHLLGIHVRNGTGVAGGTSTLIAAGDYGTALTGTSVVLASPVSLTRGDVYRVLNTGTCATLVANITIEGKATPGADVTS